MKMSFQYHYQTGNRQKVRFMSLSDAYHGETLGALSAGGLDLYSELYKPLLLDIVRIPAPDCYRCPKGNKRGCCQAECIDAAQEAFARHGDECAALLVEPLLQGSAGMRMYPPAYLAKLRSLCDAYNVHLIADEIATGFGRTGSMFACDQAGVSPDIMCVSKGLTAAICPCPSPSPRRKFTMPFMRTTGKEKHSCTAIPIPAIRWGAPQLSPC